MVNNRKVVAKEGVRDLVCFSHLRWDFVYQRPQHLMSRLARHFRVFFVEEPVFGSEKDTYSIRETDEKVFIVTLLLNETIDDVSSLLQRQKKLVSQLIKQQKIEKFIAWYYTPIALKISSHLCPEIVIYDCMDELSAFKFAPAELKLMEAELFKKAQLVFTGGHSLYEAKKHLHQNIFSFPSSIEKTHFAQARCKLVEPADQAGIMGKRFGFYGVIDERFNISLIKEVAERCPHWQFILVGPVVKISQDDLPALNNIYYLGSKSYKELPLYLSGWDIALIPFEKNESTRFISPTKTPEYLAAGKPVISASIMDVVTPYGDKNLVHIADNATDFIQAAEQELAKPADEYLAWLKRVDSFLENASWDNCVQQMMIYINRALAKNEAIVEKDNGLKSVA